MAFLAKGRRQDLINLAHEMGEILDISKTVPEIKREIKDSKFYEEEEVKLMLERIIAEREEHESQRESERRLQHELELKRLEIEATLLTKSSTEHEQVSRIQLAHIISKFDEKRDDMSLYLINFERRAKMAQVPKKDWVAYLLSVLPADICHMLARESPEEAENYDAVKSLILKRYKLNSEELKQCFYRHQKSSEESWRQYAHELKGYFTEWIRDLKLQTFQQITDLMITEQIKYRVPSEIREHFLEEWIGIMNPLDLAEKLDKYESIRHSFKDPRKSNLIMREVDRSEELRGFRTGTQNRREHVSEEALEKGYERRTQPRCFECGSYSHLRPQCDKLKKNYEEVASNTTDQIGFRDVLAPFTSMGKVNGREMPILRDTGASLDLICKKYVHPSMYTNETVWVRSPLAEHPVGLPLAKVEIDCVYGHIKTEAAVLRDSLNQGKYILGNKTAALLSKLGNDDVIRAKAQFQRCGSENNVPKSFPAKSYHEVERKRYTSYRDNNLSSLVPGVPEVTLVRKSRIGFGEVIQEVREVVEESQSTTIEGCLNVSRTNLKAPVSTHNPISDDFALPLRNSGFLERKVNEIEKPSKDEEIKSTNCDLSDAVASYKKDGQFLIELFILLIITICWILVILSKWIVNSQTMEFRKQNHDTENEEPENPTKILVSPIQDSNPQFERFRPAETFPSFVRKSSSLRGEESVANPRLKSTSIYKENNRERRVCSEPKAEKY